MRRSVFSLARLGLMLISTSIFAQVTNKKLTGQDFIGEITIDASPAAVWAVLTDLQKFSGTMGIEYKGAAKKMEKIGDNAPVKFGGDSRANQSVQSSAGQTKSTVCRQVKAVGQLACSPFGC